jgi:ketosteroid isomerase-like protein
MLSDGDRIRNLLGTYCELIDLADYESVGALFGDDGVLATEDGTELARGAEAIAEHFRELIKLHDGAQRTKHLVADTVLTEEGDSAMTARSSFVVLQATADLPLQPIIAGRYVDRFRRGGDGDWRWVERRYIADLVGHLSQHIGRLG